MRSRIGLVWCLCLLLTAAPAYAGGGHRDYGYRGGHGYHPGYWRDRDHRRHQRHRRHGRHHDREGAYLLGGIVIGTVLGHALAPRPTYGYPTTSLRHHPDRQPLVSRRLFRDLDGNCFERHIDGRGRETLVGLPSYECAW